MRREVPPEERGLDLGDRRCVGSVTSVSLEGDGRKVICPFCERRFVSQTRYRYEGGVALLPVHAKFKPPRRRPFVRKDPTP